MGQQIVKQPNGLYAIWSSVVDDFTLVDATRDEIIESAVNEFRESMVDKVRKVTEALDDGRKPYFEFTRSFDECIAEIRKRHGDNAESLELLGL